MVLSSRAQVVIHESSDGKDIRGVHSCSHDLESNVVILMNGDFLIVGLVAGRI
ncbi:DNA-directed RNA polymerase II subunit RPB7 [Caligus rogercresseyi]|uniref:DNA-directed RNA polymerase II subunit RPB7 n=1 Tax=Caligus rogercresseyi TaxID=217165 RepID=A0A7T8QV03_CALRO|nr:DNA-directed RNA polymerase II subunit RPB7 [Caligus rogercresseyi]